jgi:UDP-N-acetylglucosamine 2-epimerase
VLVREGVDGDIFVTGDPLADVLLSTRDRLPESGEKGEYVLATAHRNYNTDSAERLGAVLDCLAAAERRVIFPVHPRTRKSIEAWGLEVPANVEVRDPVTYTQMLALERDAVAIATDSGGVQREAYLWGVPCVTMREETEWIETVSTGWDTLVGADAAAFKAALAKPAPAERPPIFGDGTASQKIARVCLSLLEKEPSRERSYV